MTNNQIKVFCPNLHIVENNVMLKLDSVASAVILIGFHQRKLVSENTFLFFSDTFGKGKVPPDPLNMMDKDKRR